MVVLFALALLFGGPSAQAAENAQSDVSTPRKVDHAEYVRLSQELEKLAKRNAWAGVERTYEACLATGATLGFDDHRAGAHAAQALGNVTEARKRLLAANEMREDTAILNWLWEIDSNYGQVFLAGDVGDVELTAAAMPFNPNQAKSVEYAIEQVGSTGFFEGYLPAGSYRFRDIDIKVQPRVNAVRVDLRTDDGRKKLKKKQRSLRQPS